MPEAEQNRANKHNHESGVYIQQIAPIRGLIYALNKPFVFMVNKLVGYSQILSPRMSTNLVY